MYSQIFQVLKPKQSVGIDVTLDRLEKICKFLYSFAKGEKILAGLAISGASKPEISEKISSDLKVTIFHFLFKQTVYCGLCLVQ